MKKRLMALLLTLVMAVTMLAGCGGGGNDEVSVSVFWYEESDVYLSSVRAELNKALEDAGVKMASAEVSMIPQTYVSLTDETDLKNINKILDLLDDDDDVQEVYHNWEE